MSLNVNEQIFEIWKKYLQDDSFQALHEDKIALLRKNTDSFLDPLLELCPITYKKKEYIKGDTNSVHRFLFMGYNPSFNEKWYEKCILQDSSLKNRITPKEFFSYQESKSNDQSLFDLDYSLRNKTYGREKNYYKRYFKPVLEFICDCFALPYSKITSIDQMNKQLEDKNIIHVHIDPFFIRGTVQKDAEKILFNKGDLNEFGRDQFNLFEKMISTYEPSAIISINASTSNFLNKEWNNGRLETSFNFKRNNLTTKVFCGGMLSGGRAMDNYSKQRLIKEIKNEFYNK